MSSTTTIEQVKRKLESALKDDIADFQKPTATALSQFRNVIAARKQVERAAELLASIEEGLKTPATEEWERLSEGRKG